MGLELQLKNPPKIPPKYSFFQKKSKKCKKSEIIIARKSLLSLTKEKKIK